MVLFYILMFILAIPLYIDTFFPKLFRGELIIKIKQKDKGRLRYAILWGLLLVGWSISLIVDIMRYRENNLYTINEISIPMILLSILNITTYLKSIEIREKGMYLDLPAFFKFNKINSYTWESQNVLKLNYKSIFKKENYHEFKFNDMDNALKVDEILQNYVKKV